jgi:hypothetical protein
MEGIVKENRQKSACSGEEQTIRSDQNSFSSRCTAQDSVLPMAGFAEEEL